MITRIVLSSTLLFSSFCQIFAAASSEEEGWTVVLSSSEKRDLQRKRAAARVIEAERVEKLKQERQLEKK